MARRRYRRHVSGAGVARARDRAHAPRPRATRRVGGRARGTRLGAPTRLGGYASPFQPRNTTRRSASCTPPMRCARETSEGAGSSSSATCRSSSSTSRRSRHPSPLPCRRPRALDSSSRRWSAPVGDARGSAGLGRGTLGRIARVRGALRCLRRHLSPPDHLVPHRGIHIGGIARRATQHLCGMVRRASRRHRRGIPARARGVELHVLLLRRAGRNGAGVRRTLCRLAPVRSRRGPPHGADSRSLGRPRGLFLLHRAVNPTQSLWPVVPGYVGSRGEAGASDWVKSAAANIEEQTRRAFQAYFWRDRVGSIAARTSATPSPWTGTLLAPGMSGGGLLFVPVLVFGAIGLVSCLRHPIDRGLWLALAVAGWLPAVLSVTTARRFLVFDLGWCALAAFGLLFLLESALPRPSTGAGRWRWGWAVLAGIALWSAAALGLSWMSAPSQYAYIPFGDSGFGDGSTCLGCIRTGRVWQEEIQAGRMVVMFDTDVYRENATMPGGVPLYGKTAALAAGHPGRFLDFYAVASNYDPEPPRPGPIAPVPPADLIGAVGTRIEAEHPDAIVWWFTQPNAWEQRLIDAWCRRVRVVPRPRRCRCGASTVGASTCRRWHRDAVGATAGSAERTPSARRSPSTAAVPAARACQRTAGQAWPMAIAPNPLRPTCPLRAVAIPNEVEVWGVRRRSGDPVWFDDRRRPDGSAEVDLASSPELPYLGAWRRGASGTAAAWSASDRARLRRPLRRWMVGR